jgi:hypothetical protein
MCGNDMISEIAEVPSLLLVRSEKEHNQPKADFPDRVVLGHNLDTPLPNPSIVRWNCLPSRSDFHFRGIHGKPGQEEEATEADADGLSGGISLSSANHHPSSTNSGFDFNAL